MTSIALCQSISLNPGHYTHRKTQNPVTYLFPSFQREGFALSICETLNGTIGFFLCNLLYKPFQLHAHIVTWKKPFAPYMCLTCRKSHTHEEPCNKTCSSFWMQRYCMCQLLLIIAWKCHLFIYAYSHQSPNAYLV